MKHHIQEAADVAKDLISTHGAENALELVSQKAKELVGALRCSIFIVERDDGILWTKLSDGIGRIVIALDAGVVGDTFKTKKPQMVNNPYEDKRFLATIDKKSGFKTQNILTVPIFDSRQEIIGIIQLLNKKYGDFDTQDLEKLTFFANYISGTLEMVLLSE